MNRATNQHSNTDFNRRLFFLGQAFTGYDWALRHDRNHDAIKHYAAVGRELRAQAFKQGLRRLAQAVAGAFRRAAHALKQRQLRQASIRELARLSDHQLRDIGLLRADIPVTVDRLLQSKSHPLAEPQAQVVTVAETNDAANDDGSKLAA